MEVRLNSVAQAQQKAVQTVPWAVAIEGAQGVFRALALILSVRIMLVLTLVGGFYLANVAMGHQTAISVVVLVAYSILVILPVVVIEYGPKIKRDE